MTLKSRWWGGLLYSGAERGSALVNQLQLQQRNVQSSRVESERVGQGHRSRCRKLTRVLMRDSVLAISGRCTKRIDVPFTCRSSCSDGPDLELASTRTLERDRLQGSKSKFRKLALRLSHDANLLHEEVSFLQGTTDRCVVAKFNSHVRSGESL